MTDTPKILSDMTDAEIGALVRVLHNGKRDGKRVEVQFDDATWIPLQVPVYLENFAYRIAPPKFLPLEAGKVYRTCGGELNECIRVSGRHAWLKHAGHPSTAYVWNSQTGEAISLSETYNITGLSDNQEASK